MVWHWDQVWEFALDHKYEEEQHQGADHFGKTVIGCWELDETKRQVDQQGQNQPRERVHIPTHRKANRRGKAWEAEEKVEGRSWGVRSSQVTSRFIIKHHTSHKSSPGWEAATMEGDTVLRGPRFYKFLLLMCWLAFNFAGQGTLGYFRYCNSQVHSTIRGKNFL